MTERLLGAGKRSPSRVVVAEVDVLPVLLVSFAVAAQKVRPERLFGPLLAANSARP
jgi:hypothetical protein